MSDAVLTETEGAVLVITINRPEAKNAVNAAVAEGIAAAIDEFEGRKDLSVAVLTGAGGAFGLVLRDTGVGDELAEAISSWNIPAVLVPFLIASMVRIAQGSGTVAMITAASVTAPMVAGLGISPLLAALACCAGSMVFSYFNDSYFWVVTRFTGLDGVASIRGWSGITTAVWLGSLPILLLASLVL